MQAITPELLTKFDVPGPRYTSYPTADRFVEAFGEPGVKDLAPGWKEARILAQAWSFNPKEISVPVGTKVTFYVTTKDVQHGFDLTDSNINMMIIPGQISKLTTTFTKPGTYNWYCHEYCGVGHQTMYGTVTVTP